MDENITDPTPTTEEPPRTAEQIAEETNNAIREHIEHEIADPLREELEQVKTENARLLSLLRGTSHADDVRTAPDYIAEENKRRRENKSRQRATYPENP